jgi:hypothetical protein
MWFKFSSCWVLVNVLICGLVNIFPKFLLYVDKYLYSVCQLKKQGLPVPGMEIDFKAIVLRKT